MKKDSKGFSIPHVLLILIFVGIVGFAGWRVRENQQKKSEASRTAHNNKSNETKKDTQDSGDDSGNEDYKIYAAPDNSFSITYPAKFLDVECEANSAYIGLALDSEGLLSDCEGEPKPVFGSIIDFSSYANPPSTERLEREPYDYELSYTTSKVFINNKEITKVEIIYIQDDLFGRESETKYYFSDGKNTWVADYTKLRAAEDLATDFKQIVDNWKF